MRCAYEKMRLPRLFAGSQGASGTGGAAALVVARPSFRIRMAVLYVLIIRPFREPSGSR